MRSHGCVYVGLRVADVRRRQPYFTARRTLRDAARQICVSLDVDKVWSTARLPQAPAECTTGSGRHPRRGFAHQQSFRKRHFHRARNPCKNVKC